MSLTEQAAAYEARIGEDAVYLAARMQSAAILAKAENERGEALLKELKRLITTDDCTQATMRAYARLQSVMRGNDCNETEKA